LAATSAFEAYMDGDTGLALYRGIVFVAGVGGLLTSFKAQPVPQATAPATGNVAVYQAVNPATGEVEYIGITRNFAARALAHLRLKGIQIQRILGLANLSTSDARSVEQVLIEYYGLGKNGGTLLNKINSISPLNPNYAQSLLRGVQLLRMIGYPGF